MKSSCILGGCQETSLQFLTNAHFISPSLSDFNPSGVLKCLWILKKVEKTQVALKRKVRTLLIKKPFEGKQEDGDILCSACILTWSK